jgi:hypothetical protein
MKRQRRRRHIEFLAELGRGVTLGTSLHQHPKDRQSAFLSQGGKAFHGILRFHASKAIELLKTSQDTLAPGNLQSHSNAFDGVTRI